MVHPTGVEPAAHSVGGYCSIHLSYGCKKSDNDIIYSKYDYGKYLAEGLYGNNFKKWLKIFENGAETVIRRKKTGLRRRKVRIIY